MKRGKIRKLRELIERGSGSLPDADALQAVELFPAWEVNKQYAVGDRVQYVSVLYSCLQPHTLQETWNPGAAPSLWAEVLIPDPEQIPEWKQPDSTNPYKKGNKVRHNGKTWASDIDGNVWEPGFYGWTEIN